MANKNGKVKSADGRKHLSNYRVLQKNLVYVVGLSQKLADVDVLKKPEFFGKFGKILKVVVGTTPILNNAGQQTSCSAYVTYERDDDALRAIEVF
jgi:CCR4-NOT transcription complex subunit 4